jgi:two-component system, sensor histidine kinase
LDQTAEFLTAYLERYREMFPVRLLSVAAIGIAAVLLLSPVWGAGFVLVQFAAYLMFIHVVTEAAKRPGDPRTLAWFQGWTELLTIVLTGHVAVFTFAIWQLHPDLLLECLLLVVGNMVLGGLQVHMSWRGFLLATAPPSIVLLPMLASLSHNGVAVIGCTCVFDVAVVAAAWRQQQSDRWSAQARAERAGAADELRAALALAEQERIRSDEANRAKSKFLAMISHEVRTPLNVVLGMASVLKPQVAGDQQSELVHEIEEAGGMLLRLLNGALDLSKIESGESAAVAAPVDLRETLQAVARVWKLRVHELGLRLEVDCDGAPEDFCVRTDGAKVEQVVINFLSNALKLTPSGTIAIRAIARREAQSEIGGVKLRIEVHDEGPGVAPEYRERVFEPFEQLEAGRVAGGAGLGLAICRANVQSLGGRIGVENRTPRGAVFWFEFHADAADLPDRLTSPPPPTATSAGTGQAARTAFAKPALPPAQRPLRVLAAEDHPANRMLLSLLLEQLGAEVELAENGQEAVTVYSTQSCDVVLMDALMPVLDGVGALAAIREAEAASGRRTPIYMLTANVFDEDVARYLAAGADGVLRKPIELPELAAVLERVGAGIARIAAA